MKSLPLYVDVKLISTECKFTYSSNVLNEAGRNGQVHVNRHHNAVWILRSNQAHENFIC